MKRIPVLLFMIVCCLHSHAQFGGLVNKVKSAVSQGIDKKQTKPSDKTISADQPKDTATIPASMVQEQPVKSFTKYDFVPGEQIVYIDNFEGEPEGELPVGWNTKGTGELVHLDKINSQWLRLHHPFLYLSSNKKAFIENYTIEFDLVMQLKNNGWAYPSFSMGWFSTGKEPADANSFLTEYKKYLSAEITIFPGEYGSTKLLMQSFADSKLYFKSDAKPFDALEKWYGKPVHVAIQVQKERVRMWLNEVKAFDIPKGIALNYGMNQLLFSVGQTNYKQDQYGIYITNIKIARGIADTRHKLLEEGKFSTTAILFDVNAATIKPQSAGAIKEIGELLKQNEGLRIKIIGHTDSDGNEELNVSLSQKRAEAVRSALITDYGIDGSRIETEGKGEAQPVADNKTKEGKAANRRVEFVKL